MVEISDIPDGDNGGAPNKKPQEQPGEVTPTTSLESLPTELIESIVARVPICDHPAISLISKLFGRIVASPNLRLTRSKLGITERYLYALVAFPPLLPCWYILYKRNASSRLRRVNKLPPMPYGSAVVTIGHDIYVIGGTYNGTRYLASVTVVDCRTHTCRFLPGMKVARYRAAAGVVNGRIYVMGGCENRYEDWIECFDLERQIWLGSTQAGPGSTANRAYLIREFVTYDVVKDKIYGLGRLEPLHVYDPEVGSLDFLGPECELCGFWHASSCVVDDMLYTIEPGCWHGQPIIVFDPEEGVWKPVRGGVYGLPPCVFVYAYESRMANVGGKLVILVGSQSYMWSYYGDKYICCVEIALEKRGGDEIWGRVERVDVVFKSTYTTPPVIELCRTVIV